MKKLIPFITGLAAMLASVATSQAQTSIFTYQGKLDDASAAANGTYQMQFALFPGASTGSQIGSTLTFDGTSLPAVQVTNGVFTVQLDFGSSPFTSGADRYLEISVKHAADPGYTTLAPRQQLTSSPYSIRTLAAGTADALSANCVGCVTNAQINGIDGSKVTGTVANATNATNASNATNATTANSATTATSFSGSLSGDVTGTQSSTVVSSVGGQTATNVATGTQGANNATSANTASTIVKRDASGNFAAGTITGNLSGNATTANSANTANSASTATNADNAANLNNLPASNYVLTSDSRLTDSRSPTAGSTFYIQNQTGSTQTGDFSLSGTGAANIFDATTQFNLNGNRILSTQGFSTFVGYNAGPVSTGLSNTFVGAFSGFTNSDGQSNTFVGINSGKLNDHGTSDTFVGADAGTSNTESNNSFFGASAGHANTTGTENAFFGAFAGTKVTTAPNNAFFGTLAGYNTVSSGNNAFFGAEAGYNNTGLRNSFFGTFAGYGNTSGNDNIALGNFAGQTNTTGTNNTILGANADTNASNLIFASAIGGNAKVSANDTIVLGKVAGTYNSVSRPADAVLIPGSLTVSGTITGSLSGNATTATTATNSQQLGGVAANQYVGTSDSRLSDARTPTAGSANYVQNTTSQQTSSNFNISGNGTLGGTLAANTITASNRIGIGTTPNFKLHIVDNAIPSIRVDGSNTSGAWLQLNNTGTGGHNWGILSTGTANGEGAGNLVIIDEIGGGSVYVDDPLIVNGFGLTANTVTSNTQYNIGSNRVLSVPGTANLFAGVQAGQNNTGSNNSFIGMEAGFTNASGNNNSFVGAQAGQNNTAGSSNSFVGTNAGDTNTTGSNNTVIGSSADVGSSGLTNATAIGANSSVTQSNSVVLGNNANVGIGLTAPLVKLHVIETNSAIFRAARFESSSTTGTWEELVNTSPGGHTWALISSSTSNGEGAGNLVFVDTTGGGKVVMDNTLQVPNCSGCTTAPSDKNLKENFAPVDRSAILRRITELPIETWNYKTDSPEHRHIGPMAQDFSTAFGLNGDDKHIDMIDEGGVALAAIQELYRTNQAKDKQISDLTKTVEKIERFATLPYLSLTSMLSKGGDSSDESPSPNISNGNVVTNDKGEAVVVLPAPFDALNRDFRYQLTVIGQFAQAIVAEEIAGNQFVIKTDKPHVHVSWQVTGIRHDKFATN